MAQSFLVLPFALEHREACFRRGQFYSQRELMQIAGRPLTTKFEGASRTFPYPLPFKSQLLRYFEFPTVCLSFVGVLFEKIEMHVLIGIFLHHHENLFRFVEIEHFHNQENLFVPLSF